MSERFGQTYRGRLEDARLLVGNGLFVDDMEPANLAYACLVRSPHAHARIISIDYESAKAQPGVLAVLTGNDLRADAIGTLPCVSRPRNLDGSMQPVIEPPYHALAMDRVRLIGEPVALVVANSLAAAQDAADSVIVDYESLPSVTDTAAAAMPDAPPLWDTAPGNLSFTYEIGDKAAVAAAFAKAAHVMRQRMIINRVSANPLEPRAIIGDYDRRLGRYILTAPVQTPHQLRQVLAAQIFRVPEHRVRIISPDVGGGFGMKGGLFREDVLVLWAARRLGRPVKWTCTRSEAFLSDDHARDNVVDVALALDSDGRFLALDVDSIANLGAYLAFRGAHPPTNNLGSLSGVYATPAIHARARGVFSNSQPTSSYRGAGRPEAIYMLERIIDLAATETGLDRLAIRRLNAIPVGAMPYRTNFVFTYDSGAFDDNMRIAAEAVDWSGFAARRADSALRGRLRGIGIANCIEQAGGPVGSPAEERVEIRFDPGGGATVLVGTMSNGQGHETVFTQLVAEALGISPSTIRIVQGDTDVTPFGRGTYGSRSIMAGGSAIALACAKVVAKGRIIAAHLLEAAASDIAFAGGRFTLAGTDRSITFLDVVKAAFAPSRLPPEIEGGLDQGATFVPPAPTYPNGCHICELEIDRETGEVDILRYLVVDDVGAVLDHMLVEGQVRGGIAQGLGQILCENIGYDSSGQLVTASFMDYAMPRATGMPNLELHMNGTATANNPLGAKGAGEAGTIGALPAAMNAIVDALSPLGVRHLDMPATTERIWRAMRDARLNDSSSAD